jgi:hypothetical protein
MEERRYVGIDLHRRRSVIVRKSAEGEVIGTGHGRGGGLVVGAVDAPGRGLPRDRVRRPRRARGFFESLVADNVGDGRPHQVSMVFARPLRRPTKHPYVSRIFSPGTEVSIDFRFKHSRVKKYLKGRALRIETVINKPSDIDVLAPLEHLPELVFKGRQVNDRLLMIERAGQGCASALRCSSAPTSPTTERAREPEPLASAIHAPWPWPAPCAWPSTPSPASPTEAFAGSSPDCSGGITAILPARRGVPRFDPTRVRLELVPALRAAFPRPLGCQSAPEGASASRRGD